MGKDIVLIQCDPESFFGKLISETLGDISELTLEYAEDRGRLQQKLSSENYALVVIDLSGVQLVEGDDQLKLSPLDNSLPPVLYILHESQDVDSILLDCEPEQLKQIDFLDLPVSAAVLKQKVLLLLELHRLKQQASSYKLEADEKSLELEVIQQELLEKNYRLELLTSLDNLTGLFNRYYFDENLQKEWRQAVRQEEPLSLLFINVDYLKLYNEHYGRLEGDEVLRELAMVLHQTLLRPVDVVARYGGDQFAVILPATDGGGAELVATRMREHVDALKRAHHPSPVSDQLTISIGGATIRPQLTQKIVELTGKAECALEEAKQAGRNCSCCR